jgi:hypothetical protein
MASKMSLDLTPLGLSIFDEVFCVAISRL